MSVDSPIQVDIEQMSEETLNNLKEVYATMSILLQDNDANNINDSDAMDLLSSLQNIKVRDGIFKYFTILPKDMRIDVLKGYTLHLDYAAKTYGGSDRIADATAYLGALMVIQAAFKLEAGEDADQEIEIFTGLFKDADRLGCEASLLRLLQVALMHGVPPTVFKDSIDAVPLEECVEVN